ncbi:MAG: hypothetical protein Q4B84_03645 [Clostridia bacterium]|nr:hypothetical protein [Clostridia bacterium]
MKYYFLKNNTMKIFDIINASSREEAKKIFFEKDSKNIQRFKRVRLINQHQYDQELKLIKKAKKSIELMENIKINCDR